jgi:hypothetical protein
MHPIREEGTDRSADVLVNFSANHSCESLYLKNDLIEDIFEPPKLALVEDFREHIRKNDA